MLNFCSLRTRRQHGCRQQFSNPLSCFQGSKQGSQAWEQLPFITELSCRLPRLAGWVWWFRAVIAALRRLRQEGCCEFRISLGCIVQGKTLTYTSSLFKRPWQWPKASAVGGSFFQCVARGWDATAYNSAFRITSASESWT